MYDPERFSRHLALDTVGPAGQGRLARAKVVVIGVGGLGCPAALYLATSGVQHLVLNDFDRVDISNLPRQVLFRAGDVGERKVDVAAHRLKELVPDLRVDSDPTRLDPAGLQALCEGADVVLDCTDNFETRLAINAVTVKLGTSLVTGAAVRNEGQLAVFKRPPVAGCYRCIYSSEDETLGDCQGNGVLAPVPGAIGTLMALEAINVIVNRQPGLDGKLLLWDGGVGEWRTINVTQNCDCPTCGGPGQSQ